MAKRFKIKYCRECGETWVLMWNEEAGRIFGNDFYFFDSDYEFHKVFHGTYKLINEIKVLLGGI